MNRNRPRRTAALGIVAALIVLVADGRSSYSASAFKPEKPKLNVALAATVIQFLPTPLAVEKGFFADEGLTVQFVQFQADSAALQAMASGDLDLSVGALNSLIVGIDSGMKFKVFWGGYNMPIFEWYAQPRFTSLKDVKAGRYGITKSGSLSDFLTRHVVRQAGLNEKEMRILQLGIAPNRLAGLKSGQLDVAVLSHPTTFEAAEQGFKMLLSQKEAIGPEWPTQVLFAHEDLLAKHPNTLKAFLRAHARAVEYIQSNLDEAAQMAVKLYKYKPEHARKALQDYKTLWSADGRLPSEQTMKTFWQIAVQAGDVKEAWPNSKWLDDRYLKTYDEWRRR